MPVLLRLIGNVECPLGIKRNLRATRDHLLQDELHWLVRWHSVFGT